MRWSTRSRNKLRCAALLLLLQLLQPLGSLGAAEDLWRTGAASLMQLRAEGRSAVVLVTGFGDPAGPRLARDLAAEPATRRLANRLGFVMIDRDDEPALPASWNVEAVPTLLVITAEGSVRWRLVGAHSVDDLLPELRRQALALPDGTPASAAPENLLAGLGADDPLLRQRSRSALMQAEGSVDPELWQLLNHPRLPVRVDAHAILAARLGNNDGYDAFAVDDERRAAANRWREQVAGMTAEQRAEQRPEQP